MAKQKRYPAKFVKLVKAEYPNYSELHRALDNGDQFAGRYLDDNSSGGISPKEVVKMIDQGKIKELRKKADQLVRRQKLYHDWSNIAQEMF